MTSFVIPSKCEFFEVASSFKKVMNYGFRSALESIFFLFSHAAHVLCFLSSNMETHATYIFLHHSDNDGE